MLPELTQRLQSEWEGLFPDVPRPSTIRYLGLPGSIEGGTATFLGFGDDRSRPDFAVKVHRDPTRGALAWVERENLGALRTASGRLASTVPRAILCEAFAGRWMLAVSIVDGRPMGIQMTSSGTPDTEAAKTDFAIVTDWLCELHEATLDRTAPARAAAEACATGAVRMFLETFPLSVAERDRVERVEKALPALLDSGVVLGHGDFCRHNVLVTRRPYIGVIDWTQSERHSVAGRDLFFFLATYFLQVRTQHGIEGFLGAFEDTFFRDTAYGGLIRECVRRYAERVRIDPGTLRDRFALAMIRQAVDEYQMVLRCARRAGLPRFITYLAALRNATYDEAQHEQLWARFFQRFVAREGDCVL